MIYKINRAALSWEIGHIGVNPASEQILLGKGQVLPLKVTTVRTPAANIIKQEMLAVGGDAAVPAGCILNADKYVDIILLGTQKHYLMVLHKLKQMPYFGIAKIITDLEQLLQNQGWLPLDPQETAETTATAASSTLAAPESRDSRPGQSSRPSLKPPVRYTKLADGRELHYDTTKVMGIINLTPDSFFEGSRRQGLQDIVARAEQMLLDGADLLDLGGESTRPGSQAVEAEEELRRVVPAVEAIKKALPQAIISIDTYRAATAKATLEAGADIINDISAMEADEAMAQTVLDTKAPIILMHMRGTPKNMQQLCQYKNVVQEVAEYLHQRADLLRQQGLGPEKLILDPGIGFAKDTAQNLQLMQNLDALASSEYPVLLAASRKGTIGQVLGGLPAEERLEGTLATTAAAVQAGCAMVRVHDVREHVRFIRMLSALF